MDDSTDTVEKAKGDPQVAVYTADGTLVGVVDQSDISPIAAPAAPEGGDAQNSTDNTSDGSDDASDADGSDATAPAAEPAPEADSDAAPIPGTDTVQAPTEADDSDDDQVTKAQLAELVKGAVDEATTALTEQIDVLKAQLAEYGAQPAPGGPRLNGASGTAGLSARGGTDTDEAEQLRNAARAETDPERREELSYAAALAGVRKAQAGRARHVGEPPLNAAAVLARFTN